MEWKSYFLSKFSEAFVCGKFADAALYSVGILLCAFLLLKVEENNQRINFSHTQSHHQYNLIHRVRASVAAACN